MFNIRQINSKLAIGMLDLKAFSAHQHILEKRDCEKKGVAFILNKMLDGYQNELKYAQTNKPYLAGRSEQISISHSHDKLVLIINTIENTGIDIELIRDKVQRIQHKFLREEEIKKAAGDTETLVSFWAIKETLYKLHGLKEVDFKKHLFIDEYGPTKILGRISIEAIEKKYLLAKEKHEDYVLIYALHEV